jgi:hypothetical protein
MDQARWEARENVIRAALHRVTADYGDETSAHYDADREYADDWLDSAAAGLAEAIKGDKP